MCGICGKLTFGVNDNSSENLVEEMLNSIHHRGPDDKKIYKNNYVQLAQARLAIIDIRHDGTAPLSNEDGSIWVTFNGEIYNFQELRKNLEEKGHIFKTHTDTEVLVHLYEEYKEEMLHHLRGMFAFVIWDNNKQELFGARDRLGKKPFYYYKDGNQLSFASEIKSLLKDPSIKKQPNFKAIDAYLSLQYVPVPFTAFENIYKLPAGHYFKCGLNKELQIKEYWAPYFAPKANHSIEEWKVLIKEKLNEAVKLRMISEVPIGAFLSGGIDSGIVVALMASNSSKKIKTFSIGVDGFQDRNELPFAKLVSQKYDTEHHEFIVKPDIEEMIPWIVNQYDEPFADFSAIPTYYVSKLARQEITVALSGDGGDESFAGYTRYGQMANLEKYNSLPSIIKNSLKGSAHLIDQLPFNDKLSKASRFLKIVSGDLPERYNISRSILKYEEKLALYHKDFKNKIDKNNNLYDLKVDWDDKVDPFDWLMKHDQLNYLSQCLNIKVDIASMSNSLEVRSPFLDHKVVEFAYSIPSELKWKNNSGKYILKEMAKNLLPNEILTKPKTGFSIPMDKWLRNELASYMREVLLSEKALKRNLFNKDFLKSMIEDHISGKRNWSNRLWSLLCLELWFIKNFD